MARGNQREIDRDRARKRNADKGSDNKREGKSDFVHNKEKYSFFDLGMLKSWDRSNCSTSKNYNNNDLSNFYLWQMDTVFYVGNKFCGLFLLSRIIEIFDDLIHKITYSLDYFHIFFSQI